MARRWRSNALLKPCLGGAEAQKRVRKSRILRQRFRYKNLDTTVSYTVFSAEGLDTFVSYSVSDLTFSNVYVDTGALFSANGATRFIAWAVRPRNGDAHPCFQGLKGRHF